MRIRQAQGFALIDLIFVCGIIGVLASMAVPRLLLARQAAGSASAIGSMRAINSAELTYALSCGSGFYAPNLSTLGTPPPGSNEPFIGGGLGTADVVTKSSYTIQLDATAYASSPQACNGLAAGMAGQGFRAAADPAGVGNPRYFSTNATGTIFEDLASLFAAMPEVGVPPSGHPIR
ncbi:MAG TPA: type II secretion system protein [Gemmatimonadaceae bacterium]|nr:type II secretion system protein [Gemmatimonadaceae bacterium]